MKTLKPPRLRPGDVIGLAAPASPPATEALQKGIAYLERLGYRVELGYNLYLCDGYLAGSDEERAADLHQLFYNRHVRAIFAVRGGYGTMRLLHLLKYNMIVRNPKIVAGFSDLTALQSALFARTGLVTFSGPMLAGELGPGMSGASEEDFWKCLTCAEAPMPVSAAEKARLPVRDGSAEGTLVGGNLSLVAGLAGTPFVPPLRSSVILLEEVDERPYRIDRMLRQLRLAGAFRSARGVVLGSFKGCEPAKRQPSLSLERVFRESFAGTPFPVFGHIPYGHIRNSRTLPLGVRVSVDASACSLRFLEGGVSE